VSRLRRCYSRRVLTRILLVLLLASPAAADVCKGLATTDDQAKCLTKCDARKYGACAELGLYWVNTGSGTEIGRGIALLEKACDGKSALGCGAMGSLVLQGTHVQRDVPRALKLLETGCKGNDGLSCESLGGWYAMGEDDPSTLDIPAATQRAVPYYERACALKRPAPCAFLATFILDGIKFPNANRKRVVGLLKTACSGDVNVACKLLGDAYAKGELVKRDKTKANELYAKSCTLGYDRGCSAKAD
jgi:TPR repeat protein